MKIGLLHYSSPPVVGGVESVLAQHARLMQRAGHEVAIFTGRGESFDKNIPFHRLPRLNSRHAQVLRIKRELDAGICPPAFHELRDRILQELSSALQGFDLLIAHNVASLHKNLALTAALKAACQSPGFPRLALWHHDLAWTTPRYRSELHAGYPWDLIRTPWEGCAQVVVSAVRRHELSEMLGISEEGVRVIPNGVDVKAFFKLETLTIELVEQLSLDCADPLFLLPVRLTPRKNIELALHVLAEIRTGYPQAMLLVTGPEGPHNPTNSVYKRKLLRLRDDLGLKGVAHFLAEVTTGFVPDPVIADFYRLGDALLFPSREEGFGIPIIEAAFSSMPVFCADIPVLRELGGQNVSYFDPDAQPDWIATQITSRLESEATIRWARLAKRRYGWDAIYTYQIEPFIQEVVL